MLGSGSGGNATLLASDEALVLIDVGLSYREVAGRLDRLGLDPARVDAIVITHAHGDHTRGAQVLSRRHGVPVYTTAAIRVEWGATNVAEWCTLKPGRSHDLRGFRFFPFAVPHDAAEAVGFRIDTPDGAIGYATDIGTLTPAIIDQFRDCRVLVLESNHATELLRISPYAQSTRIRIASNKGHLSNESLAAFIRHDLGSSVRCIVLAHLSRVNNVPEIAELTCREALTACGRTDVDIVVACQDQITPTIDLSVWAAVSALRPEAVNQAALPFGSSVDGRLTTER